LSIESNGRRADHDIDPVFLNRWSTRAFTGEPVPDAVLMSLFEAARWAPSSFNGQPWRFVYARRGGPDWDRLLGLLIEFNQEWVKGASALAFVISQRFRLKEGAPPVPIYSHSFDAGAAWAYLALQAHHMGWSARGMTGFDHARSYEVLEVPQADYRVEAAIAVGRPGGPEVLAESYRAAETPTQRRPVSEFAFEGRLRP